MTLRWPVRSKRIVVAGMAVAATVGAATIVRGALRGHGGPVRALALSKDGQIAATGSFDSSAIIWLLENDSAAQVLRFHAGAVNAVALLPDGGVVTAGEDAKIAVWERGKPDPVRVLEGHRGPVAALAVAADGRSIASASWDRTVRLWPIDDGAPRLFEGHADNVNGVAFSPDGKMLVSASYDATIRLWPLDGGAPVVRALQAPVNAIAVAQDGEIVAASADGRLRILNQVGDVRQDVEIASAPLIAVAVSPDGATIAVAGLRGAVALIDRKSAAPRTTLIGPALPVWSLQFSPDGATLFAAGSDRVVRRWDAKTGEARDGVLLSETDQLLKASENDAGAEVFKACVACHTLTGDDGHRAGPSLHRLFGRKIATAPGYRYSDALTRMDIVWTPETVAKLFEMGPSRYTPGTKMPEQTLSSPQEREALIKFLARVTQ